MQARSGELWWSTLADDSYSSSIYLFQSKYIITEDPLSVASQHSSALFLPSAGSAWQELKERYSRISELRLQDLKRVTFYFWTLQEKPASHKVTLFSSFLHVWPDCRQVSYFHVCMGPIHQSQLVRVRSPPLLDRVLVLIHLLNGKSPQPGQSGVLGTSPPRNK